MSNVVLIDIRISKVQGLTATHSNIECCADRYSNVECPMARHRCLRVKSLRGSRLHKYVFVMYRGGALNRFYWYQIFNLDSNI